MTETDPWRVAYRFVTGRPVDGVRRTDGGYLRRGRAVAGQHASSWARRPGWHRQVVRLGTLAVACSSWAAYTAAPQATTWAGVGIAAGGTVYGIHRLRRWWRMRRFNRMYIRPTVAALKPALGDAPVQLHVSPELGTLVQRLARSMSPAEVAARRRYATYVEPVLRWLPDLGMRCWWTVQRLLRPVTSRLGGWLRPPRPDAAGPRIALLTAVPYVEAEARSFIQAVVAAKLPAGELNPPTWDQVGTQVSAVWTAKRRPPAHVGYADLDARLPNLKEWEFFLGLGVDAKPVTIDLQQDSPHIALSAGTGAGKSVLAQLLAVQVLARGGRVVILDIKGSHRWALGMPGVDYCTQPAQMHDALIRLAELAGQRNADALHEPEGWDPGQRILVVAEELNATTALLRAFWARTRQPGGPKPSPGVEALQFLLYMGRAAKVHVLAVAQMLTALATGGPAGRENFGIRCLARYTVNAWKMLVPEAAMPRASRTLGRWQVVIAGVAQETQVCYLSAQEARLLVAKMSRTSAGPWDERQVRPIKGDRADFGTSEPVDPREERVTLRTVVDRGLLPNYEAARKRLQRARKAGAPVPVPCGRDGNADLFRFGDVIAWIESEMAS